MKKKTKNLAGSWCFVFGKSSKNLENPGIEFFKKKVRILGLLMFSFWKILKNLGAFGVCLMRVFQRILETPVVLFLKEFERIMGDPNVLFLKKVCKKFVGLRDF